MTIGMPISNAISAELFHQPAVSVMTISNASNIYATRAYFMDLWTDSVASHSRTAREAIFFGGLCIILYVGKIRWRIWVGFQESSGNKEFEARARCAVHGGT